MHEVAVGRQGVLAAQRPHRPARARAASAPCGRRAAPSIAGRRASRPAGVRVDRRPAAVLGRLHASARRSRGSRRTTARPSRSTAASGPARTAPGRPARSTSPAPASPSAGSRGRACASTWLVQASAQTTTARQRYVVSAGDDLDPAVAEVAQPGHRRPVAQHRAAAGGQRLHQRRARTGGHDRAALLVQPDGAVRQRELRPPAADLVARRAARGAGCRPRSRLPV